MSWSGKALGGLFGALVGGPVGAGVGAAVGHYLGDAPARGSAPAIEIVRLGWVHHVFRASGPGVELVPVWIARGLRDRDVTVRMDAAGTCETAIVSPELPVEEIEAPRWFLPYARVTAGDGGDVETGEVSVTLRTAGQGGVDRERFGIPMPRRVRRLGNSGPGRIVMALVACARAGGRALGAEDREWIRIRFCEGHPLDADGCLWLEAWMDELSAAEPARLSPARVAERVATRLDREGASRLLMWLMHGARAVWPGSAGEAYIAALARAWALEDALDRLWAQVALEPDPVALTKAAATLGIPAGSPPDVARAAYRTLVQRWHPDRARTAVEVAEFTQRSAAINAAWAIFSRG